MESDYEKERREALDAGQNALDSLRRAKLCLDNARSWGIWDILGGGMVSSLIKHDHMDKARQHLFEAKSLLQGFEKELRDLNAFENINLDTKDLLGLADVFMDGFLADAMMQNRIHEAQLGVDRAIRRVEEILQTI